MSCEAGPRISFGGHLQKLFRPNRITSARATENIFCKSRLFGWIFAESSKMVSERIVHGAILSFREQMQPQLKTMCVCAILKCWIKRCANFNQEHA